MDNHKTSEETELHAGRYFEITVSCDADGSPCKRKPEQGREKEDRTYRADVRHTSMRGAVISESNDITKIEDNVNLP